MKLNTPNKLTVSRMFLAPVFLLAIMLDFPHKFLVAEIIFAIAAVTDAIDGRLARKNNEITVFGKLLDPVADKMLTTAALLGLMAHGLCNVWIVMVILTREFVVTSLRLIASSQGIVIPANIWGKLKTATQMIFTIIVMGMCEADEVFSIFPLGGLTISLFSNILLGVTAVLAAVSGIIYIVRASRAVDFSK